MKRRGLKETEIMIIIFSSALLVRWIAVLQTPVIARDTILYIKAAKSYYTGGFLEGYRACPFSIFPLLLSSVYPLFGDWVKAGQWLSATCGALTVVPLYLLARRIFDKEIALAGSLFYIICPDLVRYSAEVLRDIPFLFLYLVTIWLGYKGIKDDEKLPLLLAGLFIPVATSLRQEGSLLLPIFTFYILWLALKKTISMRKALICWGAITVFCFLSMSLPFLVKKPSFASHLIIKIRSELISGLKNPASRVKDLDEKLDRAGFTLYQKKFFQLAQKYSLTVYLSHIIYKTIKPFSIPLFLLFLFGVFKRRTVSYRVDEFILLIAYVAFEGAFLVHLNCTSYLSTRYPLPLVALSLIWSGAGFVELRERVKSWLGRKDFRWRVTVMKNLNLIILLLVCIPLLSIALAPHRKDKLELKEIGIWLKGHGLGDTVILGQKEFDRLAFYAGCDFVLLGKGRYKDILRIAKSRGARILVINARSIERFFPDFWEKLSPEDMKRVEIPDIKTPKYATTVFLLKTSGE